MIQTTQNCCSFRIGSFSVLTGVCILASFLCQIYEFLNKDIWNSSLQDLVLCNIKNQVQSSIHLFIRPDLYIFILSFLHTFILYYFYAFIYSLTSSSCHVCIHSFILHFVHLFIYSFFIQ